MSDSKHTPGPWKIAGHIQNSAGIYVCGNDSKIICNVLKACSGNRRFGKANVVANALLIAAAPDLLEVCERLRVSLSNNKEDDGAFGEYANIPNPSELIEMLSMVIFKAKGGSE